MPQERLTVAEKPCGSSRQRVWSPRRRRACRESISVMKADEDRGRVNSGPRPWSERGKVFGSIGSLHVETTMGTAVVVARELPEDALRVMLIAKENVVGTASADRADHPLAERRGPGPRARGLAETAGGWSRQLRPYHGSGLVGGVWRPSPVPAARLYCGGQRST